MTNYTLPISQEEIRKKIAVTLGIESLSTAEQDGVIAAAFGPILQSVSLALAECMPEGNQTEFLNALQSGDSAMVEKLITTHVSDPTFIEKEIQKAIEEFKTHFDLAKK